MHSSVSIEFNFPKHAAAKPKRQRIAFEPNHNVHEFPISMARPRLYLLDSVPRFRKLHDDISGAHAGGPFVTSFSNDSCISLIVSSSGGVPFGSFFSVVRYFTFYLIRK